MNEYRCETCKHHTENEYMDFCHGFSMSKDDPTELVSHIIKYGCASHSDYKKITFDSIANEIRLTDAGFVKCEFGDECDHCNKYSEELYTHLDWETSEADSYRCPDCAFKELKEAKMDNFHIEMEIDKERNKTLQENERREVLVRLHPLFECIKKHWGEPHGAPVYQYNKLEKALNDFEETLRNSELDERENSIISEIVCFTCNQREGNCKEGFREHKNCVTLTAAKERFRGYV